MAFNVPQTQQVGYEAGPSIYNFYTGKLKNPKVYNMKPFGDVVTKAVLTPQLLQSLSAAERGSK